MAGKVLLSAAAQEMVRGALPPGCLLVDMGSGRLKDLAAPERIYQLQHFSLPSAFPPLRTLSSEALPNNLPQQATSFIGREKEIAEVKELLSRKRLLTLVGAGGAGKTRLALQAAADLLDGEGDGVWLVELAALTDASLVTSDVAQALGVQETAGQPMLQTLINALKGKRLLIVLDNCEHVIAACAALAGDLLRHCPGTLILATSHERLNVAGEQVYRVPSLQAPHATGGGFSARYQQTPSRPVTADTLFQYDSVRLFTERAKAVHPAFTVTDQNAPALAQLCSTLDGIPLAIELAAARVRSMMVEQVNERLDQRFRLLTGGARATLPRQQTLKALIDWSYDLLSKQEKTLLARVSVFAGGWTLAAAEAVCTGEGIDDWEMLDLLTSLTDKSMVVYDEPPRQEAVGSTSAADAVDSRYHLLETIRQYGDHRPAESGEAKAQDVRHRHRDWCVALAEEAEPRLTGAEQASCLSRLETEHENIRAALAWREEEGGEEALRLSVALWRFWTVRGHFSEGRHWLTRTLQPVERLKIEGGTALAGAKDLATLQARGLSAAGNLARNQGDYASARALHQQSLEIRRGLGDQRNIAGSLNNLGLVAFAQSDYSAAQALLQESLEIRRGLGDQKGIAESLQGLGSVAHNLGDLNAAGSLYRESLEIMRQIGNPKGVAGSLEGLAKAASSQGRRGRGVRLWSAAAALREQIGAPMHLDDRQEYDARLTDARAALGDAAFNAAWTEGQAMSSEQAVGYAFSDHD